MVRYSADRAKHHSVDLRKLDSALGKSDAGFEFYADGRLMGVNAKGVGQGADALKALAKFAAAAAVLAVAAPTTDSSAACKKLRSIAGDGKPLTIVHRGATEFRSLKDSVSLRQLTLTASVFEELTPIFGTLVATYEATTPDISVTHRGKTESSSDQLLTLIEPGSAAVTVAMTRGRDKAEWPLIVPVPQHGREFQLPIQQAPWFGTNEIELKLAESGKVTKLRYAGASDAAGFLGALTDASSSLDVSTGDEAKAVQAQADLIFQQQRLVLCQANPVSCPK